jgi:hypothetical protein
VVRPPDLTELATDDNCSGEFTVTVAVVGTVAVAVVAAEDVSGVDVNVAAASSIMTDVFLASLGPVPLSRL